MTTILNSREKQRLYNWQTHAILIKSGLKEVAKYPGLRVRETERKKEKKSQASIFLKTIFLNVPEEAAGNRLSD